MEYNFTESQQEEIQALARIVVKNNSDDNQDQLALATEEFLSHIKETEYVTAVFNFPVLDRNYCISVSRDRIVSKTREGYTLVIKVEMWGNKSFNTTIEWVKENYNSFILSLIERADKMKEEGKDWDGDRIGNEGCLEITDSGYKLSFFYSTHYYNKVWDEIDTYAEEHVGWRKSQAHN